MRPLMIVLSTCLFLSNIAFCQPPAVKAVVDQIKASAKAIDQDKLLQKKVLPAAAITEHVPDGGAELTGFFKGRQLQKVSVWIGLSYGTQQTDYYFENDVLLHVHKRLNAFPYDTAKQALLTNTTIPAFDGVYFFTGKQLCYHVEQVIKGYEPMTGELKGVDSLLPDAAHYRQLLTRKLPRSR
ncbi:hypothetical protein [Chitinophaga arvensicola]|uniref:Uncharacterized protein n=1 Tax=Chitinophaga arvensicola TaxID=29529 RepID=A0A1I0SBC1_9BACT|nr:hypothetical protein [Chitinophaga arvensicola]SEW54034.1 hypothetical protein SAMN04488122_5866 [Chitinophaga arvensicola]